MTRARFHLTFPEHLIEEPILYRVGKEFEVITNIRRANIDERSAWVILEMEGAEDEIARAVRWLAERGVQVDRIQGA